MENKFSCIIVDDERHALELLSDSIRMLFANVEIVGTYSSWQAALNALRTQPGDVVCMDISMPGKNGMDLLRLLPELDAEIIFVTAHEEYALRSYEFSTAGYLLKPIDDAELVTAMDRAIKRIEHKRAAKQHKPATITSAIKIGIPNNKGIDYINVADILYLESINKCTRVVTATNTFTSSNNLGKFKELIDKYSFFQVHRSFIINLHSVVRYESEGFVIMPDKKEIPVSKNIRSEFLQYFERIF